MGHYDKSIEHLDQAEELEQQPTIDLYKGSALFQLGRYEEAINVSTSANDDNMNDHMIRNCELLLEMETKGKEILFNPDNLEIFFKIIAEFELFKNSEKELWANQIVIEILEKRGEDTVITIKNVIMNLASLKRYEEAFESLDEQIRLNSEDYELFGIKGKIYLDLEEYKSAENSFLRSLEIKPENETSLMNLGNLYTAQGLKQKADPIYKKLFDLKMRKGTFEELL